MRPSVIGFLDIHRMRLGKVVEAGDMPQREWKVGRGLPVRRIESAAVAGKTIGCNFQMKCRLDGGDRAFDLNGSMPSREPPTTSSPLARAKSATAS